MTIEEYNRICIVYQFLTKRFDISQFYSYDGFYKCYDPNYYGVRGDNRDALGHFQNLNLRHVYTAEHIASRPYGENYINSNLVVFEQGRVCIHNDVGFIFLYVLVHKLQDAIRSFLTLLKSLNERYTGFIRVSEDGRIYKMKIYTYDSFIPQFEAIENYRLIFHLFALTNSNFMVRNWENEVEINVYKIEGLLETLNMFNFENVDMNF